MAIPPTGAQGTPSRGATQQPEWRDGQLLRATVERGVERAGETAILRLGRQQLPVQAPVPLTRGMDLLVQVIREQQTLALKLLELPTPPRPEQSTRLTEQLLSSLRQSTPRQESPTRLMTVLQTIARAPQTLDIPQPVRQLAREAIKALPDTAQIQDPASLRRAVNAALEATRATIPGGPPTRSDGTTGLYQLVTRLIELLTGRVDRPASTQGFQPPLPTRLGPPQSVARWTPQTLAQLSGPQLLAELLAAARGTQSRQTLQQLAGLEVAATASGDARWHVELPVRFGDTIDLVSLVIERETRRNQDGKRENTWQATLALSLPDLGGIQARIALVQEQFSIDFHIEEHTTLQRMEHEISRLRDALEQRDLGVFQITLRLGRADAPEHTGGERLVDIKA